MLTWNISCVLVSQLAFPIVSSVVQLMVVQQCVSCWPSATRVHHHTELLIYPVFFFVVIMPPRPTKEKQKQGSWITQEVETDTELEEKMKIIKAVKEGQSYAAVDCIWNVNKSTIRSIYKCWQGIQWMYLEAATRQDQHFVWFVWVRIFFWYPWRRLFL